MDLWRRSLLPRCGRYSRFYFGSKSNGGSDHALASKIVSAVRERE
jgi:hypothetical protein